MEVVVFHPFKIQVTWQTLGVFLTYLGGPVPGSQLRCNASEVKCRLGRVRVEGPKEA